MQFNSFSYVLFLWAAYVLFWTLKNKRQLRYAMVLVASYWFYGQSHWGYVSLLVVSTIVDYFAGLGIESAHGRGDERAAKTWLGFSLVSNLGLLGTFKYFDFFSANVEALLRLMGFEAQTWRLDLILPVGISFYTFQTLSYSIDVYRKRLPATRSFLDFSFYVAFFPQLVAGPIVRAIDFLPQMALPTPATRQRIGESLFLIIQGMAKKLLLADVLAVHFVDPVFARPDGVEGLGAPGVILLGLGFTLQVYGDFSGYSDIAIGSAKLLGFELRPNFNSPLRSPTLDAFWQRWHISMSSWFRDYIYIGLGGSRKGVARACANNFITLVVVGLWHGSNWNHVTFGAFHGLGLACTRIYKHVMPAAGFRTSAGWSLLSWLVTVTFVSLTILLYRAPDMGTWSDLMGRLGDWSRVGLSFPWQIGLVFAVAFVTQMLPQSWCDRVQGAYAALPAVVQALTIVLAMVLLFGLQPPGTVPFYYFQF